MTPKKTICPLLLMATVLAASAWFTSIKPSDGVGDVDSRDRLVSLPYVGHAESDPFPQKSGVTYYDRNRSYAGVNLYVPLYATEAVLMGMDGGIIHNWSYDTYLGWHYAELTPDGGLIFVEAYLDPEDKPLNHRRAIALLDSNSSLLWMRNDTFYHHDMDFSREGRIYALTRSPANVSYGTDILPVMVEGIDVLSKNGSLIRSIPLYGLFEQSMNRTLDDCRRELLKRGENRGRFRCDIFHANTVDVIDRDVGVFKKGDLLLCIAAQDIVAVLDPLADEIVWSWGKGVLDRPHMPSLLANGDILLFDNGFSKNYSRVIEVDPASGQIVWEYKGDPPDSFFSDIQGSAQKLPNGNVLIAESTKGRAFEVTPSKEVVWEYWEPRRDRENRRMTFYRMIRLTRDDLKNISLDDTLYSELKALGNLD